MVYDPQPLHLQGVNTQVIDTRPCDLLHINKPCTLLNVLVPSPEKIALGHIYCSKASFLNISRGSVAF